MISLLIFIGCMTKLDAQNMNIDEQLATQFYQNKEYDKAAELYEKIFTENPSVYYYTNYLNCLIELQDYKVAEKLIKKQTKKYDDLKYRVDLGHLYSISGEEKKADQEYERAIKLLEPDADKILNLANAFLVYNEYNYAILTYTHGRKLIKNTYPFSTELAAVYMAQNKLPEAISEYLSLLSINYVYLETVKDKLQFAIYENITETKAEILKNTLLKHIQKYPDNIAFHELLIWHFTQLNQFESAFNQAKALDKRNKEDGERLIQLAGLCEINNNYDVAVKIYKYVISKGENNYFFMEAKMGMVNALYNKITNNFNYTIEELQDLENLYLSTLEEFSKSSRTISLIKGLAHIQAFYLSKEQSAIEILEDAVKMSSLPKIEAAYVKIELADIYMFSGDVWESSLLYSQVEKDFKHDIIGHEAKYKNARLSYFKGEFEWAQAQLDVLKASTSKLIANDAMKLSLLITDNLGLDTSLIPMQMYAHAELKAYQNKKEESLKILDSIIYLFPSHSLVDEVLFTKANIMLKTHHIEEAINILENLVKNYFLDIYGDDALFKLAILYETEQHDITKSMELYQKLLTTYPGSLHVAEARRRYRKLRGDQLN